MKTLRQTLLLLVLSCLLGGGTYIVHPGMPAKEISESDPLGITATEARDYTGEILLVDAREREAYEANHLPGAILLNENDFDAQFGMFLENWTPEQLVVVYCDGGGCQASRAVAKRLRSDLGAENIYYLEGGIESW